MTVGKGWGGRGCRGRDGSTLVVDEGAPLLLVPLPPGPRKTCTPHSLVEPAEPDLEKPPQYCLPGPSSKYHTVTIAPHMAAEMSSFKVTILTSSGRRIFVFLSLSQRILLLSGPFQLL